MQACLHRQARDNGPGRYATGQDRYAGATYSRGISSSPRCDTYPIFDEQVALSIENLLARAY